MATPFPLSSGLCVIRPRGAPGSSAGFDEGTRRSDTHGTRLRTEGERRMPVIGYVGAAKAAPAALMLLAACAGCSAGRANGPEPGSGAARPATLRVHRGRFADRFLLTGQLAAVQADNLAVPRIPSWQTTIRWLEAEGTVVHAGQKVVEFDTSSFAQDYGEKLLGRDTAESDLEQAESDREIQRADKEFL